MLGQSYENWEMIIINDSPYDAGYDEFQKEYAGNMRIRYVNNAENQGVNYSRNRGLAMVSGDSTYVIFLDDDDYLAPKALEVMCECLEAKPNTFWLLTNRAKEGGDSYTYAPVDGTFYNYARDYLIRKRIRGDATHCISIDKVKGVRFPAHIKQAEEWLFYMQLGRRVSIYYKDLNTTYTDGYSSTGLNDRQRKLRSEVRVMRDIFKEALHRKLLTSPYFYIYYLMRIVRLVLPSSSLRSVLTSRG